jgi:hypothetical protein
MHARLPALSRNALSALAVIAAVLLTIAMLWGGTTLYGFKGDVHELQQTSQAQGSALAEANRRLTEAGKQPVPTPEPGPAGEPGPAPSDVQVEVAVSAYCADHDCDGPTAEEVALAVASYCDGHGDCIGPRGAPPTGAQILAQTRTYCASHGDCRGRAGIDGQDGTNGTDGRDGVDGKDGRGITATQIDDQGHLIVSYSDGTSADLGRVVGQDGKDGADGQSALPFTFTFTVQTNPSQSTTYTVTCTVDGCTVDES